jgi:hypothetical protein
MALSITKKQYAHLIREISDALKDNIKGGGMYDFSAPETEELRYIWAWPNQKHRKP